MPNKKEERIEFEVREGNISLVLDSYNDIFSDFDPRDYSEKALSEDFLSECKRAARDKENHIELRLLIPIKKRNSTHENKIRKRLKDHFHRHFKIEEKEMKKTKSQGIAWFILGAIIITVGAFLSKYQGFIFNLLVTIAEPAGWFSFWEGLAKVFLIPKEEKLDLEFYKKMSTAKISFFSYD